MKNDTTKLRTFTRDLLRVCLAVTSLLKDRHLLRLLRRIDPAYLSTALILILPFGFAPLSLAQDQPSPQGSPQPNVKQIPQVNTESPKLPWTPVFSGYATAGVSFVPGMKKFDFDFNPILYVPVGEGGLFLTEWEFKLSFDRENGNTVREYEYELEYLQFNQRLSKYFTGVVGKFLTPGMYNERLHPSWIKKTPDAPYTAGLLPGNGTGAMLRGAAALSEKANLTYAPFFTTAIDNKHFGSQRMVGGRVGTFFKVEGLDLGLLVARSLQGERASIYAADGTYQIRDAALDFRGEYYYQGAKGSAYWVEVSKRFKNAQVKSLRNLEVAGRFEQAFVLLKDEHDEEEEMIREQSLEGEGEEAEKETDAHGVFPEVNTNRFVGTVNYYVRDGVKLYVSYGREIVPGTGRRNNVWGFGLAYRFLK
ncbi:MAG: hypothetical protein AB1631_11390 [Acidobacteriota bacterium]